MNLEGNGLESCAVISLKLQVIEVLPSTLRETPEAIYIEETGSGHIHMRSRNTDCFKLSVDTHHFS